MTVYHDEIEIEDMEFDEETEIYTYPCPCGDKFEISLEDLQIGEEVATCPRKMDDFESRFFFDY